MINEIFVSAVSHENIFISLTPAIDPTDKYITLGIFRLSFAPDELCQSGVSYWWLLPAMEGCPPVSVASRAKSGQLVDEMVPIPGAKQPEETMRKVSTVVCGAMALLALSGCFRHGYDGRHDDGGYHDGDRGGDRDHDHRGDDRNDRGTYAR